MRLTTIIGIGLAISAGCLVSAAQQRGALVATLPNDVKMEFVRIQPGQFMMGCSPGDDQCAEHERPAHTVRITRGFEIGKYEVTSEQWQVVMVTSPFVVYRNEDKRAAGFIGWSSIQEFFDKLNARKDGYTYRLPTEAEWEYSARAGATSRYTGPDLPALGWIGQNVYATPQVVGQKKPNAWELSDVHGNVWEWTQDFYDRNYYSRSPASDPKGPDSGQYRVLRGGSALSDASSARLSARHFVGAPVTQDYYGFRVVREPVR